LEKSLWIKKPGTKEGEEERVGYCIFKRGGASGRRKVRRGGEKSLTETGTNKVGSQPGGRGGFLEQGGNLAEEGENWFSEKNKVKNNSAVEGYLPIVMLRESRLGFGKDGTVDWGTMKIFVGEGSDGINLM